MLKEFGQLGIDARALPSRAPARHQSSIDPQLLHLALQGRPLHPQPRRRSILPADYPVNLLQHPPDMIALAFEPFRQVDSHLSREVEGTGLGLPLVKKLIELHGGEVRLESVLKKGTSVFLSFPASRCAPIPIVQSA